MDTFKILSTPYDRVVNKKIFKVYDIVIITTIYLDKFEGFARGAFRTLSTSTMGPFCENS